MRKDTKDMVTIANFGTLQEAEMLRLKLASMGINAFIPDAETAGVAPYLFNTPSGVRVQVREDDVEEAMTALDANPEAG
ncbi:MAG: DUF2007 domain-containing protein [Verrucomicrobiota bacterium]